MKIVIVEDNISFCQTLKFFVEQKLSYRISAIYNNPLDFIESLKKSSPDLVLMDIQMPGINGLQTTEKALWMWETIKVIAVTNHSENVFLDELIKAGCKGCVFKDNLYEQLSEAIETVKKGELYFPNIKII